MLEDKKHHDKAVLAYTARGLRDLKDKNKTDPNMNVIDEYSNKYKKYSSIKPTVQKKMYELQKLQERKEFAVLFQSTSISQEQKDVLSNLLIRCQRKEMVAIKVIERKILDFYKDKLIDAANASKVLDILKNLKIADVPQAIVTTRHYAFPFENKSFTPTKEEIEELKNKHIRKTDYAPQTELTRYDVLNSASDLTVSEGKKTSNGSLNDYDLEFREVLADCKEWIIENLEERTEEQQQTENGAKPSNDKQLAAAQQGQEKLSIDQERTLDEEIQKIVNIWESSSTEMISDRWASPEIYPPYAIKKAILEVVGVEIAELEKGPLTKQDNGNQKEKAVGYGAWYIPPKKWQSIRARLRKGDNENPEKIKELETRAFIRKRVKEIVDGGVEDSTEGSTDITY